MKAGIFLEQNICVGGGFQQAFSVAEQLLSHPFEDVEYVFFVFTRKNRDALARLGQKAVWVRFHALRFLHRGMAKALRALLGIQIPFRGYLDGLLDAHHIDLAYFLTPSWYAMGLKRCPFIFTVWDQCHRDWPEFPEVYANLEFERREFLYRSTLPKAVAIFVDSETSRQNMIARYGIDRERVYVAPFFPAPTAEILKSRGDVREKYGLQRPFIFYPAQLWAHKNHVYILEALDLLRNEGILLDAVFTGTDFGNGDFLRRCVSALKLKEQIHWLGFLEREDILELYREALALVMPTYFGPTNIPPLEAFQQGCPVCYPDLQGLREQVGDGAFLLNLADPESLSDVLKRILSGGAEVRKKIQAGCDILQHCSAEHYLDVVHGVFEGYTKLLRCHSLRGFRKKHERSF